MQPDSKGVCPDTVAQAHAVAGDDYVVLMTEMFGAGYGDTLKTSGKTNLYAGNLLERAPNDCEPNPRPCNRFTLSRSGRRSRIANR